uniref:Uncharacterized protein n=1 Tax=Zea mays TaxID=4577 RepID=A0A804NGZ4_MAIZE
CVPFLNLGSASPGSLIPSVLSPSHTHYTLLCCSKKEEASASLALVVSNGHHRRVQPPQVLLRGLPAPFGHAHHHPVVRGRGHPARRRRPHPRVHLLLPHPALRPDVLPVQPHQGVHRVPRDDPALHDGHDHPRRHRRGDRGRRVRGPVLRVRAVQGPHRERGHRGAVRVPGRRRVAGRAAVLGHGGAQAGAPVPGRAGRGLRRGRGLRGGQARGAVHVHRDEPAPGAAQREAVQRRGGGGPDRAAGARRRRGHQLGARVHEPRHAVVHGPQRDGGQGGGQLLRPRRALRRHRRQEAPGHRHDQRRARDEGARHERRRGRDRAPHARGRARHDRHRDGGRRDRRRPEDGPDVRRHDDLRPEGGAPGAEGTGQAQRRGRDHPRGVAGAARGVRDCVQGRRGRGRLSEHPRASMQAASYLGRRHHGIEGRPVRQRFASA